MSAATHRVVGYMNARGSSLRRAECRHGAPAGDVIASHGPC